jgi:hypothetical protein
MNLISDGSIPLNSIFKRSKDFYLPSLRLEEGEGAGQHPVLWPQLNSHAYVGGAVGEPVSGHW